VEGEELHRLVLGVNRGAAAQLQHPRRRSVHGESSGVARNSGWGTGEDARKATAARRFGPG
jgi:hypothetical protein